MIAIVKEGIENFTLTLGDIAWIIGFVLTGVTLFMIFRDKREKKRSAEIAKIIDEKKVEAERLRDERKEDQKRFDILMAEERQRHSEAITKREEEVRTLVGIGKQLTQVSESICKIESKMDLNQTQLFEITKSYAVQESRLNKAWEEIEHIKSNCNEVQREKLKGTLG